VRGENCARFPQREMSDMTGNKNRTLEILKGAAPCF
jgi:hypothetical protein